MIINFHSDESSGLLKLIDKHNVPLIITSKLYDYPEGTFIYKKGKKPQKLFISKEKIDSTIFDGWQVLLVSDQLIDGETFNISDNETYIMYHTNPEETELDNFLNGKSYKHKKKGQHEREDQWGYNLINYIFNAYSLEGFNIQKYDDAIKKIIDWFDFNEELEAKLELLHKCLTPGGAENARDISNYDTIKTKVENVKIKCGEEKIITINYLSKQSDCFDKDTYIDPLTDLRDALLTD